MVDKALAGKTYYIAICIGKGNYGAGVDDSYLKGTCFKQILYIDWEGNNA